ncbi:hypothetical protein DSM03_102107 [Leeuwenhoekiella aestuarii]|uniref:Uncharacterized protein n=1 Tax=Leeuwenhoekiella aestuarii TaxID=2249426 RepID=A0A4Q0NY24_9FLAO|nr:hypothetical protein DSM04_103549 [Leeuwenhoekiella aestuarii]RXG17231.1 hypothetical protein DSM03_102107 [Leeuwenhoekiella aestuarii]
MSFGGSVSAMLASLKHNKRERKTRFNANGLHHKGTQKPFVDHKKLSQIEEVQLKSQIQFKAKQHRKKNLAYTFIAFITLGCLIWWLFLDSDKSLF